MFTHPSEAVSAIRPVWHWAHWPMCAMMITFGGCRDTAYCYELFYHDAHVHHYELIEVSVDGVVNSGDEWDATQLALWSSGLLEFQQSAYGGWLFNDYVSIHIEEENDPSVAAANVVMGGE